MNRTKITTILALAAAIAVFPACRRSLLPEHAGHDAQENGRVPAGTVILSIAAAADGGISAARVETAVLAGRISVPGELEFNARRLAEVSARVEGRIEKAAAVAGDRVVPGQILAEIYSREFLAAQAEVLQAAARAAA